MNKLSLDSTQTLRALTRSESQEASAARWFVVQLVLSDRPINLDMMPRLEVFASYKLYAVAGRHEGIGMLHALRLGFFSDDLSANTVCGYLKTFFASPTVVRVSAAEHARFLNPSAPTKLSPAAPATAAPARVAAIAQPISPPRAPVIKKSQRPVNGTKSLAEQLLDEARQVHLSRSGRHRAPEQPKSWISRLLGAKR